ncbi:uncharacterized protein METZ01_LOCUS258229 [marine metagenome]|uniref:Uncharacterized protein n=1 Tax=marine metagenome TaxID=408172 RepID=A0A382J1D7_9ZZZZ
MQRRPLALPQSPQNHAPFQVTEKAREIGTQSPCDTAGFARSPRGEGETWSQPQGTESWQSKEVQAGRETIRLVQSTKIAPGPRVVCGIHHGLKSRSCRLLISQVILRLGQKEEDQTLLRIVGPALP